MHAHTYTHRVIVVYICLPTSSMTCRPASVLLLIYDCLVDKAGFTQAFMSEEIQN